MGGALHVDGGCLFGKAFIGQEGLRIEREMIEIGYNSIADPPGALDGFNQAVDMGKALMLAQMQLVVDAKRQQLSDPLTGRRMVVKRCLVEPRLQGLAPMGPETGQIPARHKTVQFGKIGGNLAGHIAAIEIIQSGLGELVERLCQSGQLADLAFLETLVVQHEMAGKMRRGINILCVFDHIIGLAAADRHAFAGMGDGLGQNIAQRQFAADRFGQLQRRLPATHRTGNRQRRIGAAQRHAFVPQGPIGRNRRPRSGIARGIERMDFAVGFANQPETVAANPRHMRIDHRNRRPHRDHGLDGIAAGLQNRLTGLGRQNMRCDRRSAAKTRRVLH